MSFPFPEIKENEKTVPISAYEYSFYGEDLETVFILTVQCLAYHGVRQKVAQAWHHRDLAKLSRWDEFARLGDDLVPLGHRDGRHGVG